ncbi:MAG: BlaI/MecI/CopY family transcriptional regulator [Oscillospiraceae bacterium]|nr:BlaI/MecI/CopY family transcriptional regulator [Oscillospiraceae bacterium]
MDKHTITLSQSEWHVMEALWSGPKTLMELVKELQASAGWAKSTVTTMVRRMEEKSLISYEQEGRTKLFRAAVLREDVVAAETDSLLTRAYRGSARLLMNALVSQHQLTKADIEELYAMLQQGEEEGK